MPSPDFDRALAVSIQRTQGGFAGLQYKYQLGFPALPSTYYLLLPYRYHCLSAALSVLANMSYLQTSFTQTLDAGHSQDSGSTDNLAPLLDFECEYLHIKLCWTELIATCRHCLPIGYLVIHISIPFVRSTVRPCRL